MRRPPAGSSGQASNTKEYGQPVTAGWPFFILIAAVGYVVTRLQSAQPSVSLPAGCRVPAPRGWGQFCWGAAVKAPIFDLFTAALAELLQKKLDFSAGEEVCSCKSGLNALEPAYNSRKTAVFPAFSAVYNDRPAVKNIIYEIFTATTNTRGRNKLYRPIPGLLSQPQTAAPPGLPPAYSLISACRGSPSGRIP